MPDKKFENFSITGWSIAEFFDYYKSLEVVIIFRR